MFVQGSGSQDESWGITGTLLPREAWGGLLLMHPGDVAVLLMNSEVDES